MGEILQKLCGRLTRHRFRRGYLAWPGIESYYCRCCICHHRVWTGEKPKRMIQEAENEWIT